MVTQKKQQKLPAEVVLESGEVYVPVLFRVLERDCDGRPESLGVIYPGTPIEVNGTDRAELIVAYIDRRLLHEP